jgi:hypothetical protein
MSLEELDRSTSASVGDSDALAVSNQTSKRAYFNLAVVGFGLIITFFLLLTVYILSSDLPKDWIIVFLAGLVTGFALGTVFGLWIAKSIGYDPSPWKFSLATGIVVLNACVGFFGFSYVTTDSIWPNNQATLGWSIGVAGTLVSAAMLCLVNFVWHTRDQKRIHILRAILAKNRAKIAEAEAKAADAQRRAAEANDHAALERHRADEADKMADEQRKIAELAQQETEQARQSAQGAQKTAVHAQHIAEREKRWRANRALLLGRWLATEYSAQVKSEKTAAAREIHKEQANDRDILVFQADETFTLIHPGKSISLMEKVTFTLGSQKQNQRDVPKQTAGRWKLHEAGDLIFIQYVDGKRVTLKIQSLNKTKMTIDKSSEEWELLRYLVKVD